MRSLFSYLASHRVSEVTGYLRGNNSCYDVAKRINNSTESLSWCFTKTLFQAFADLRRHQQIGESVEKSFNEQLKASLEHFTLQFIVMLLEDNINRFRQNNSVHSGVRLNKITTN